MLGIVFLILGGMIILAGKLNIHLGRLPGDFQFTRGNFSLYLPCGTSILLSILLTILLTLLGRLIKK